MQNVSFEATFAWTFSHAVNPIDKNLLIPGIDTCVWIAVAAKSAQCNDRLSMAASVRG